MMKFDHLAVLLAEERAHSGCCYHLHPHFSLLQLPRGETQGGSYGIRGSLWLRMSSWRSWEGHTPHSSACLLFQCPLLLLVHGTQSSVLPLSSVTQSRLIWLGPYLVLNQTQLVLERERRGSKSFSDVVETPGWVGMCPPKLLCHCLLVNAANISGAQQAAFFSPFNSYADNT